MPISLEFNEIDEPLFFTKARYIFKWGGRGRGGSFAFTQYFVHLITQPEYFRGYIMREVLGDIRESLWLDIKDRIEESEKADYFQLDEAKMMATFLPTGNTIVSKGFKKASKKQTAKLKSIAGATHVLIEEMEEISETDFKQLDDTLRTKKVENIQILGLFNPPPKRHWIWKKWFTLQDIPAKEFNEKYNTNFKPDESTGYFKAIPNKADNLLAIFSTYHDNESNLNASFIANQEEYKRTNPEHYYTNVMGLIPEGVVGRIFKNWKIAPCMPGIWSKFYGLDWGFSGDPLALVECENHNRSLWVEQKIYKRGLTNDDLHEELLRIGISKRAPIVADNAQPKDIEDMKRKGWNFIECKKESVKSSVKYLKQYEVHVTESSTDIWNEYENYAYALDQFKNPTEEPIDAFNHAIDAIRYALDRIRISKPRVI
jgi:phage terminase large subunit